MRIRINGMEHDLVDGGPVSYEFLVELAGLRGNPSMIVTPGDRSLRSFAPYAGKMIPLDEGAKIDCVHTGSA